MPEHRGERAVAEALGQGKRRDGDHLAFGMGHAVAGQPGPGHADQRAPAASAYDQQIPRAAGDIDEPSPPGRARRAAAPAALRGSPPRLPPARTGAAARRGSASPGAGTGRRSGHRPAVSTPEREPGPRHAPGPPPPRNAVPAGCPESRWFLRSHDQFQAPSCRFVRARSRTACRPAARILSGRPA